MKPDYWNKLLKIAKRLPSSNDFFKKPKPLLNDPAFNYMLRAHTAQYQVLSNATMKPSPTLSFSTQSRK